MAKLYPLFCILLFISCQNEVLSAGKLSKLNDFIGTTSSAVGVNSFAASFLHPDTLQEETLESIMDEVRNLNVNLKYAFNLTMATISNLPRLIEYMDQERNLMKHISRIREIFRLTYQKRKQIVDHTIESPEVLQLFKSEYEPLLEDSIIEIRRNFMESKNTVTFLTESYFNASQKYSNVCKINMSQLQVLDHVLGLIKTVYDQYYDIKIFMLDVIGSREDPNGFSRMLLKDTISSDYGAIANEFRKIMVSASKEVHKCDPRFYAEDKDSRYYYQLRQFSTYIAENNKESCEKNEKTEECRKNDKMSLCNLTRPCENELLRCKKFDYIQRWEHIATYDVCYNPNKNAFSRYHKIDKITKDKPCKVGIFKNINYPRPKKYESNVPFCECVCHEYHYFFDTTNVTSDYRENKIVTGARLNVEHNTIFIEIQEAEILPNGIIKKVDGFLPWKRHELKQMNYGKKKHTLESVDLTEVKDLPKEKVITGLSFLQSNETGRVKLTVLTSDYNFRTGKVSRNLTQVLPDDALDEYQLNEEDLPTRGLEEQVPLSSNSQYVSFGMTDLLKDGGQTTIPFIDIQNVETAKPMPLSGAGLYLRGRKGYGGFLALKLYTYNVIPFIDVFPSSDPDLI